MRVPFKPLSQRRSGIVLAALAALLIFGSGCASTRSFEFPRVETLGPDLQLLRVTDEIWIHVSDDKSERWGTVPANGLLITGSRDSTLIDTGWNEGHTKRLLEFAETKLERPVRQVILTHAHPDRAGGIRALPLATVTIHALDATARMLARHGFDGNVQTFQEVTTLHAGAHDLELFYPGAGHTRDNIVVWLPWAKILFGGCLVKSGKSADLGNREDAVLAAWPDTLLALLRRYEDAALVIPGHGAPSGIELIYHTLGLIEQDMSPTTGNGHGGKH